MHLKTYIAYVISIIKYLLGNFLVYYNKKYIFHAYISKKLCEPKISYFPLSLIKIIKNTSLIKIIKNMSLIKRHTITKVK